MNKINTLITVFLVSFYTIHNAAWADTCPSLNDVLKDNTHVHGYLGSYAPIAPAGWRLVAGPADVKNPLEIDQLSVELFIKDMPPVVTVADKIIDSVRCTYYSSSADQVPIYQISIEKAHVDRKEGDEFKPFNWHEDDTNSAHVACKDNMTNKGYISTPCSW